MSSDKPVPPSSDNPTEAQPVERTATTQVGPVLPAAQRATKRLPDARPRRPRATNHAQDNSREHIAGLIEALGDPDHSDHADAVDMLAQLGPAAVGALIDTFAQNGKRPWLTSYRAAEALGRIGDGRGVGVLIQALHHPNSNVRWSAVRAISQIGDVRAIFELRRIAHDDHGRTSWGESVAGAAQSALDQMRTHSIIGQSAELIKTAVTAVLLILSLILAFSVFSTLNSDLNRISSNDPTTLAALPRFERPTTIPTDQPSLLLPTATSQSEPTTVAPINASNEITGTILQTANVRPYPIASNQPIGQLRPGDEVVFISQTPDHQWYRVRLGDRRSDNSTIISVDGSGWVNTLLLSPPLGNLPAEVVIIPTSPPSPTLPPTELPTAAPPPPVETPTVAP